MLHSEALPLLAFDACISAAFFCMWARAASEQHGRDSPAEAVTGLMAVVVDAAPASLPAVKVPPGSLLLLLPALGLKARFNLSLENGRCAHPKDSPCTDRH
jgi:hypothetical protein